MSRRAEIISELLEVHEVDARTFLDAIVRALPEDVAIEHIEFVLRTYDYSVRLNDDKNLISRDAE